MMYCMTRYEQMNSTENGNVYAGNLMQPVINNLSYY